MDGTRDRPPGKSAENWSRKDGIRAGSVSGPWRSTAREAKPARGPADDPRAVRAAQVSAEFARQAVVAPVPVADGGDRARRSASIGPWIVAGALVAVALVVAAFLLRPEPPGVTQAPAEVGAGSPAATAEVAATPAVEPAAAEPAAEPAVPPPGPVRLRIGPGFAPERQDAIVAALEAAGYAAIQVEALPFRIATSRVGYYRAADRVAAEALARQIAPVVAKTGGEVGVRDYGQLLADPEPGRLDLWIEG